MGIGDWGLGIGDFVDIKEPILSPYAFENIFFLFNFSFLFTFIEILGFSSGKISSFVF